MTKMIFCPQKSRPRILWIGDESLEESDNLHDPDVLAQEIVEDIETALEQFREIAANLHANSVSEQDP